MTATDEELMAYVDGELDTSRRETLRQAIADSADLSRRVAEQRALRDRLRRAFDPVLKEPLPSRLVGVAARARVSDSGRAARRHWSPSPWQSGWALAAGIALGIVVGPTVLQLASEPADVVDRGVGLTADGALADALSRRLASEQSASDSILLGISFRSKTGEYCRTFISRRGDGTLAGLACRQDPGWRIEALQAVPALSGNLDGYRQAAAPWPSLVLRAAEESMVGDPLDATGEATARDRGWSSSPPTP